jgi:glucokinase
MSKQKIIGIDMGATKVHVGIVEDGLIIRENRFPASANAPKEQIVNEIINGIEPLFDAGVQGIGIGVPSLVDEEKGIVYDVQNIPSWDKVHLKESLENHFQKPVFITNDANIFVLGEKMFGEAKEHKNVVGITLGTGLGAGVVLNNNLYGGMLSCAGELGSIPYLDLTIEDYCSGKFFLQKYNTEGEKINTLAKEGDAMALEVYRQYGEHLGNLVKIVLYTYSPEVIVFGGSISTSFSFFQESMHACIQGFPYKAILERLKIKPSKTAGIAILGAAALVKERVS